MAALALYAVIPWLLLFFKLETRPNVNQPFYVIYKSHLHVVSHKGKMTISFSVADKLTLYISNKTELWHKQ